MTTYNQNPAKTAQNVSEKFLKVSTTVQAMWRLTRCDKPWGTLLLLWPSLWALWLANQGMPPAELVGIFVVGAFLMRALGCVLNDYCDRDIDACVHRTKDRPLPAGLISTKMAICLAVVLAGLAASLLFFLNTKTRYFAVIGALLTLVYPTTKRWLKCPQLFLGITFAWGVPMAYTASAIPIGVNGWILYAGTCCWIMGYDTVYAMQDLEDDQHLPIFTVPKYLQGRVLDFLYVVYGLFLCALMWVLLGQAISMWRLMVCLLVALHLYKQCEVVGQEQYLRAFKSNQWLGCGVWLALLTELCC